MRRRALFSGIAASISLTGCSGLPTSGKNKPTDTRSMDKSQLRSLAEFPLETEKEGIVIDVTNSLDKVNAEFAIGIVRGKSNSHPPQIGGILRNTSDKEQVFSFGAEAPLSPMTTEEPNPTIHLRRPLSDDEYGEQDCWIDESNAWLANMTIANLDPGETVSNKLDVLVNPDVVSPDGDSCPPPGTYNFTQDIGLFDEEETDLLEFSLTFS